MGKRSRREFLADVGRGMVIASVGAELAADLGLASARAADDADKLTFGPLEPLVGLMQDTPPDRLLPQLVEKLRSGTELRELVASDRYFGGYYDTDAFHIHPLSYALGRGWAAWHRGHAGAPALRAAASDA